MNLEGVSVHLSIFLKIMWVLIKKKKQSETLMKEKNLDLPKWKNILFKQPPSYMAIVLYP